MSLQNKEGRNVCFAQGDSNTFIVRTATLNRRHSDGGIIDSASSPAPEPGPVNRFHPYRRQFSDGIMEATGCLQQCSSSFSSVQEIFGPDSRSRRSDMHTTWDQYNNSIQVSRFMAPSFLYF